jgi:hypothetical protein
MRDFDINKIYEKVVDSIDKNESIIGGPVISYYLDENGDITVFETATTNFRPMDDSLRLIVQTDRKGYLANLDDGDKYMENGQYMEDLEYSDYLDCMKESALESLEEIKRDLIGE